jgi:hypothetical protein
MIGAANRMLENSRSTNQLVNKSTGQQINWSTNQLVKKAIKQVGDVKVIKSVIKQCN